MKWVSGLTAFSVTMMAILVFDSCVEASTAPSAICRRWCKTPLSSLRPGRSYCCETVLDPITKVVVKFGLCPEVGPQCPPVTSTTFPVICSHDGRCLGSNKCCYDTCLELHACKPVDPIFTFGK